MPWRLLYDDIFNDKRENVIEAAQKDRQADRKADDDGGKADRFLSRGPIDVAQLLP
jgi:hypothetical protein